MTSNANDPHDPMAEVLSLLAEIDEYADLVKQRVLELREKADGGS